MARKEAKEGEMGIYRMADQTVGDQWDGDWNGRWTMRMETDRRTDGRRESVEMGTYFILVSMWDANGGWKGAIDDQLGLEDCEGRAESEYFI